MKRLLLIPLTALVLGAGLLHVKSAQAQQLPIDPIGARHMALGGAAAAMTYGADAVYHNPASLVWQTLTFGGGIQPYQWTKGPRSWWFTFYNQNTDYNIPMSLIGAGWTSPTDNGDYYVNMVGMPLAFNMTPATPGAATIKFAFERDPDGKQHFGVPIDLGFLGRHPSGMTLGLVVRNFTIGSSPFKTLKKRLDYGISYGGGPLTILASTSLAADEKWVDVKERYRFGVEIGAQELVTLRGGYIKQFDDWYATGGVGLRSGGNSSYEFSYSLLYDPQGKHLRHFIQYVFLIV